MRNLAVLVLLLSMAGDSIAQPAATRRRSGSRHSDAAASALKQAAEELGDYRKAVERDLEVLRHLRAADAALADAMQPAVAVQEAFEHVAKAESLGPPFVVMQGIIRARQSLDEARRSPTSADFGRLRAALRDLALAPASRVAVSNALRLEEETLGWLEVQELATAHLRQLSDLAGQSLRATQEEK
jgi:hypothetical protein